jgi:hypothetical protein
MQYDPIVEEDSFFYLVDWNIGAVVEKWKEICNYLKYDVKTVEEMAKPLAPDKISQIDLEPEDVKVIQVPPELQEKEPLIQPAPGYKIIQPSNISYKCTECNDKEFKNALGLDIHKRRIHTQAKVAAV